jgi:hypothetical protein
MRHCLLLILAALGLLLSGSPAAAQPFVAPGERAIDCDGADGRVSFNRQSKR